MRSPQELFVILISLSLSAVYGSASPLAARDDPRGFYNASSEVPLYADIRIADNNPAQVNLAAILGSMATQSDMVREILSSQFSEITSSSASIAVQPPGGNLTEGVVVDLGDIDDTFSTIALWPGAVAQALIRAGWATENSGKLASIRVPEAFEAITGKPSKTFYSSAEYPTITRETFQAIFTDPEHWVYSPLVLQTKKTTTKLKPSFAYSFLSVRPMLLFDPSEEIPPDQPFTDLDAVLGDIEYVYGLGGIQQ